MMMDLLNLPAYLMTREWQGKEGQFSLETLDIFSQLKRSCDVTAWRGSGKRGKKRNENEKAGGKKEETRRRNTSVPTITMITKEQELGVCRRNR